MRFGLAVVVFVVGWTVNIHATATPIRGPVAPHPPEQGHRPIDAAAADAVADAVDSMRSQVLIAEFGAMGSNDIDAMIEAEGFPDLDSRDTDAAHASDLDHDSGAAGLMRKVDMPPQDHGYGYLFLALIPLGLAGFAIVRGWIGWQRERALDRYASRRSRHRSRKPLPAS